MTKLNEFINTAGTFYLATVDGDQAKVRPLGAHMSYEGVEYFGIGDFKDVYKQLVANPKCEIVCCQGPNWLRYTGKAVFETTYDKAEIFLDNAPFLRTIYNDETGNKMAVFHLEDATAVVIPMMGPGTPVEEWEAPEQQ